MVNFKHAITWMAAIKNLKIQTPGIGSQTKFTVILFILYRTPQMDPLYLGSRGGIRYVQSARNSIHGSNEDMTGQKHSYSDGETDYNFLSDEVF